MWIRPRDQKIVGRSLAEARLSAHITQQQLARKLRKPQSFVSAYESGQRRVDVLEFLTIVRAIGVPPGGIFRAVEKATAK